MKTQIEKLMSFLTLLIATSSAVVALSGVTLIVTSLLSSHTLDPLGLAYLLFGLLAMRFLV